MPHIPLIEDLTKEPIPAGSNILVEYDPTSQWYNACTTITVNWIRTGGRVGYAACAQSPDSVRGQLKRLELDSDTLEKEETLIFSDWYTGTLGQKSKEEYHHDALKISELSIKFSQSFMKGPVEPDFLIISEDESTLARFNEEKAWVEFELTRKLPAMRLRKIVFLMGVMTGIHSEWAYRRLEGGCDGVIDFKFDELGGKGRDLIRIRMMRNVHFDREWHQLKVGEKFEVTLEK